MARFNRAVSFVFWLLGLITTLVALVGRIIRPMRSMIEDRMEVRSLLWLAAVFFLGTIATWAVGRASKE